MLDKKTIQCKNCGSILEKSEINCAYCGTVLDVNKIKKIKNDTIKNKISEDLKKIEGVRLPSPAEEFEIFTKIRKMNIARGIDEINRTSEEVKAIEVGELALESCTGYYGQLSSKVARKYENLGLSLLDLFTEGMMGLGQAINKFDPTRGYRFTTYAWWWIRAYIARAILKKAGDIPAYKGYKIELIKQLAREDYEINYLINNEKDINNTLDKNSLSATTGLNIDQIDYLLDEGEEENQ